MKHLAPWVAAGVAVVVGSLIVLMAVAPTDPNEERSSALVGKPAPAITSTDTDGRPFDLAAYRGSWVLLNFFATWCVPCVREHPELVAFAEAHASRGDASVVSVAFDDPPEAIAEFFDRNGGDWQVIADDRPDGTPEATSKISLDYGVVKLPESYLVSPDGVVLHKFVGGVRAVDVESQIGQATRLGSDTTAVGQ